MATFQHLLSQARRHCTTTPSSPLSLLRCSSLGLRRSISSSSSSSSSESDPNPNPPPTEPARRPTEPIPVQVVAYPVKPKDPSPSPEAPPQPPLQPPPSLRKPIEFENSATNENVNANAEARTGWSREDIRYVKNVMPTISPVSYPSRVAPLPEDRAPLKEKAADKEGEDAKESGEIERERRRIEVEEEKVVFPTLIEVEKKKPKVVLDLNEAIREVKANAQRNFNETVEAHVKLGIDRRRTDQQVSGTMTLPHGIGKVVKVAVFAEGATADEARAAGADIVGGVELVEEIMNGSIKLDFDKCITTPLFMPRLGKIAKILGKRGLMPNPKRGTIVSDVFGAVKEAKHGLIDFKMDKTAIVHVGLGKVSFSEEILRENIGAFVNALLLAKPAGLKKTSKYAGYVDSFHLCSTMGPGFPVSIQSLSRAADHFNKLQLK
ncbi:hypothetical protein L1049_023470 [Liquidambar formosana]|uniref:Large ribosomal subunit protein uL1c n=1 Tax=Liquidambar formosana TaxID=63359 RepID=A0AAP0RZI2_LIQFO